MKRESTEWDNQFINPIGDYQFINEEQKKIKIVTDFARKVIMNSKDIDSEFVSVVDDNFWDLL